MKKISLFLLLSTLFLVPFAGSGSGLGSATLSGILSLGATVLFLLGACIKRHDLIEVVGATPLFLFTLFPLLQLIPLPPLLLEAISPATYTLYEPLLELRLAEQWLPLSVAPKLTLLEFFRFAGYACTYLLTVQLLSSPWLLKKAVTYLVFLGAGLALWSITQRLVFDSESSSPFVAFLLMTCPVAFALALYYRPVVDRDEGWRSKVTLLFVQPGLYRHFYFSLCGVLMAAAVLGDWSQEHIVVFLLLSSMFLLLCTFAFSFVRTLLLLGILVLVYTWFVSEHQMVLATGILGVAAEKMAGQIDLWRRCFALLNHFPLFGTGLGSFEVMYGYTSLSGGAVADHLQAGNSGLPVEVGAIGTILGMWFLFAVIWHISKLIRVRRDRFIVLPGIGALAGVILFIVDSILFFKPYGGLAGFHLFFFFGLLVAIVHCRFSYPTSGTSLKKVAIAPGSVVVAIAVLLLCISLAFHGGSWYARSVLNSPAFTSNSVTPSTVQRKVERQMALQVATLDPLESTYSSTLAQLAFDAGNTAEGMQHLLKAGFKSVMKGEVYQQLGLMGQGSVDQITRLLETGYTRAPHKEQTAQVYVQWLFDNGTRADALEIIGERLRSHYRGVVGWIPLLEKNSVHQEELRQLLPRSVDAWLYLGRYSEVNTGLGHSDFYYAGALTLTSEAAVIDPEWLLEIINYYLKNQRSDMAVLAIRRAITLLPEVAVFHRLLGDHYFKKGVLYRAKEEYEHALLLDPEDMQAQRQLQDL